MRPQQNRRMRGRGGNGNQNRKGPNPLTRNYESNGPDVKIRGSAQQIAEKYAMLARDAQSAGDRVMAENYLQHAEHYNRIIMAAQAQMPQHQIRDARDDDELDDEGDDGFAPAQAEQPSRQQQPDQSAGRRAGKSQQPADMRALADQPHTDAEHHAAHQGADDAGGEPKDQDLAACDHGGGIGAGAVV